MKLTHYVDLQDGPSSLQKRDGIPTIQEKSASPLFYESERKNHMQNTATKLQALSQIRTTLYDTDNSFKDANPGQTLRTPRVARQELQSLKESFQ